MNQVNPKKLLNSKWTAVVPKNKEKHFVIESCSYHSPSKLDKVHMHAILTGEVYKIAWRDLKDSAVWRIGWQ